MIVDRRFWPKERVLAEVINKRGIMKDLSFKIMAFTTGLIESITIIILLVACISDFSLCISKYVDFLDFRAVRDLMNCLGNGLSHPVLLEIDCPHCLSLFAVIDCSFYHISANITNSF